jgi:putative ATP-binding cassette transporter
MIRLFTFYFRCSPLLLLLGMALGTTAGLLAAALIALVSRLLAAGPTLSFHLAALFAITCLLRLLAGAGSHLLLINVSQTAVARLRLLLCQRTLAVPLQDLEKLGPGMILGVLTEDVVRVSELIVNLPYFFINIITLLACAAYLVALSPALAPTTLPLLAAGAISYLLPVYWANRLLRRAREDESLLFRRITDLLEGIKELQQHEGRRHDFLHKLLFPITARVRAGQIRGISVYAAAANWNRTLFFVYVGALAAFGTRLVPLPAPAFAAYIMVLLYMMAPLEAVMNICPHLARASVALQNADRLGLSLQALADDRPPHPNPPPFPSAGPVHFTARGLQFTYAADDGLPFHLGPLDCAFAPGQVTFITGSNGSGKTTLAKLLCGLYTPQAGALTVNNVPVTPATRQAYQHLFSAIFAEFHLFDQLLGLAGESAAAQADGYLRRFDLDRKVRLRDETWSTTALSRGQRKRLALVLALLADTPAYLFDEWAADQDPHFKTVFYTELLPALRRQGKTVIVITHDHQYFHLADQLLRLEDGRLALISADDPHVRRGPPAEAPLTP